MSQIEELEEKIQIEKKRVLREKILLKKELEQLDEEKFSYKRKGDLPALDKVVQKEKIIKNKIIKLDSIVPNLELQLQDAIREKEQQEKRVQRQRDEQEKQIRTKNEMNSVLRYLMQGKTRYQASVAAGVPLSRITHWYNEGKYGIGKDNVHFYHEVTNIENTLERERLEEINRKNRLKQQEEERKRQEHLKQERKRKERLKHKQEEERKRQEHLKQERKRKERLRRQQKQKAKTDKIKRQMDEIISQMRNGKSRKQAAVSVGVDYTKVNRWFNEGYYSSDNLYKNFYNNVKEIEDSNQKHYKDSKSKDTTKSSALVNCPKCGKKYNSVLYSECPNCRKSSRTKSSTFIKCPKCGKYYRSDNSTCPHCNKKSVSKDKSKNKSSNFIKCRKCGKYYRNDSSSCPHCNKKSVSKSKSNDSSDWVMCCIAIIIVYVLFSFLGVLI